MIHDNDIKFYQAKENDIDDFIFFRKKVMREHVIRQNIPWMEEDENIYNRELFYEKGLRKIIFNGDRVGYIGVCEESSIITISRFFIVPDYQHIGIGSCVLEKLFHEFCGYEKRFRLCVLKLSPARSLYERYGFNLVSEDSKLAYYERHHFGINIPTGGKGKSCERLKARTPNKPFPRTSL